MNIKYLCKKDYSADVEVKYGDIIGIEFKARKPIIRTLYRDGREIDVSCKISEDDLVNHFYLYDDIETIDTPTAITLLEWKIKSMGNNERLMLKELKYYINARQKFLNSCKTQDTRQERNATVTLHGTNQDQ